MSAPRRRVKFSKWRSYYVGIFIQAHFRALYELGKQSTSQTCSMELKSSECVEFFVLPISRLFFYNNVHIIQSPGATRGRRLQIKSYGLWRYVRKITFKSRLEQVKVVVIGETSCWESIPQNGGSFLEAIRPELEITSVFAYRLCS